jgi:hypothetical protein
MLRRPARPRSLEAPRHATPLQAGDDLSLAVLQPAEEHGGVENRDAFELRVEQVAVERRR